MKRLIGLPGDGVREDARGYIWVNGQKLDDSYVEPAWRKHDTRYRDRSWRVAADEFFMIGDNRAHSCDSRAWGAVPRANLVGPVVAVYWPPKRIRIELPIALLARVVQSAA